MDEQKAQTSKAEIPERSEGQKAWLLRKELVAKGEYEQALASLEHFLQTEKQNRQQRSLHQERGFLHLYFGHPQEARSEFDAVELLQEACFHTRPGRLQSDGPYNAIGVTYWLEERRELALAFWRYTTSMLLRGRVSYSQIGGGIEAGLLLWFGAVHERCEDDVTLVRNLYEKRLASTFWSHNLNAWPGPIVRFFLESLGEEELLNSAPRPRDLCEARFALAIRARAKRRHAAYQKHLRLAAMPDESSGTHNPWPFFLARHEVEK